MAHGALKFHFRPDVSLRVPRKERRSSPPHEVTSEQSALLGALKTLRLQIAGKRHLPAYLIFSDRSLIEMARHQPRNLHEFAMINGVGASKLRDFGEEFLAEIKAHREFSHDP